MKRTIYTLVFLFATAPFIAAGVFYKQLPTAKTHWERYEQIGAQFTADGQPLADRFAKFVNPPRQCLAVFAPHQALLVEIYAKELWTEAKHYEMHGDEEDLEHFDRKEKEFLAAKKVAFEALDKCLSDAEKGLKQADEG